MENSSLFKIAFKHIHMAMILNQEVHTHCIIFTVDSTFDRWLISSAKVEQSFKT